MLLPLLFLKHLTMAPPLRNKTPQKSPAHVPMTLWLLWFHQREIGVVRTTEHISTQTNGSQRNMKG